jgi:hypothetical protein
MIEVKMERYMVSYGTVVEQKMIGNDRVQIDILFQLQMNMKHLSISGNNQIYPINEKNFQEIYYFQMQDPVVMIEI